MVDEPSETDLLDELVETIRAKIGEFTGAYHVDHGHVVVVVRAETAKQVAQVGRQTYYRPFLEPVIKRFGLSELVAQFSELRDGYKFDGMSIEHVANRNFDALSVTAGSALAYVISVMVMYYVADTIVPPPAL